MRTLLLVMFITMVTACSGTGAIPHVKPTATPTPQPIAQSPDIITIPVIFQPIGSSDGHTTYQLLPSF